MSSFNDIRVVQRVAALLVLFSICIPVVVHAEAPKDMQISPGVIDEKAKQRDIIKESVTLTNTGSRPLNLFPAVEDVNAGNGDQTFNVAQNSFERSDSLANWIELSRGVIVLMPGETRTVPFVIHVNMNAVPGMYHAAVTFTDGTTRDATEQKNPDASAQVNVEVDADIKEDLQLVKFTTDRVAFNGDDVLFNYQLLNNGNQDLQPTGDIRIYDRRGEEVATVDVNKQGKTVSPQQSAQLASVWSAVSGFGQYKAIITVNYGAAQTASVQDTVFFWIVPWKQMLGLFTAAMIAIAILGVYFHRMFEERHLNKLALAGVLKTHPMTAAVLADVAKYMPHMPAAPMSPPKRPPPPPKIEAPKEPKDRLIVKVAENAVVAWRLFTTFKQRGRITPQDIAQERAATQPQRVVQPPVPQDPQRRDTLHMRQTGIAMAFDQDTRAQHDGTIDLKRVRARSGQPSQVLQEGHVVNLKRNV